MSFYRNLTFNIYFILFVIFMKTFRSDCRFYKRSYINLNLHNKHFIKMSNVSINDPEEMYYNHINS